jgi:glycosyltransferase involved in cell wall biosynthesis
MAVKVSILMAVYNTAPYLPQSLDSLLNQTMGDFQVICVDDASTDDSLKVLESYARRDSRIEVISLAENHGQAFARNQGLKCAQGSYICFLDSDDWLGKDALQQIVSAFEKDDTIDSVLFRCRYYYSADRIEEYPMPVFEKKGTGPSSSESSDEASPIALSGEQAFELSLTWKIHGVYAVKTSIHQKFPPILFRQLVRMLPIKEVNTNHILPAFVLINIQQMRRDFLSAQLRHHTGVRLQIIETAR